MKYETAIYLIAYFGLAFAAPTMHRREVPQEHSHEKFLTGVRTMLNINNPAGIADPVFGLLGNAAAAAGAGTITNLDCLHKATADQAFTNAKAAANVQGMTDALLYAALERNTGGVGTKSVICTDAAVNPEIEAIQQHQDPASTDAAATNKAIVLELAKQLSSVGADPLIALQSGTFTPGDLNDSTGAGNTCDDLDDPEGCIFTKKLLVEDATAAEITAAAGGAAAGGDAGAGAGAGDDTAAPSATDVAAPAVTSAPAVDNGECAAGVTSTITIDAPAATATDCAPLVTMTVTVDPPAATAAPAVTDAPAATETAAAPVATAPAAAGGNLQTFTGALGGVTAPVVTDSGVGDRPFTVNAFNFNNAEAAIVRSCDIQNNQCANAANSGAAHSVGDCNAQQTQCIAQARA